MNQQEYLKLYNENQALIVSVVQKKLYDKSHLDDVIQEVWLKVWAARKTYDKTKSAPTTWLTAVAESTLLRYLEKNFEKQPALVMDSDLVLPAPTDKEDESASGSFIEEMVESPYNLAEQEEILEQLIYAGATLSEQESAVFNLVYWHGWSYEAVAKKFDIEEGSVRNIVWHARTKIESGMRPSNDSYRYFPPGNVWGDWSFKPNGLGNLRMTENNNKNVSTNSQRCN